MTTCLGLDSPVMPDNDALKKVRAAGRAYARAQAKRDTARDELFEAIRQAHAAGEQPKELIEASGVARQTVFDAIKAPPAGERPEVVSYP